MDWTIEVRPSAREDLRAIFRHLVAMQHETFGYDLAAARALGRRRTGTILSNMNRLATAPFGGGRHDVDGRTFRHVTIDRAIYWFQIDEDRSVIVVEGIFHGGQDHLGRMLDRLTREADGEGGA